MTAGHSSGAMSTDDSGQPAAIQAHSPTGSPSVSPGFSMVGATLQHLKSLRRMQNDGGWIHTLLAEAENERRCRDVAVVHHRGDRGCNNLGCAVCSRLMHCHGGRNATKHILCRYNGFLFFLLVTKASADCPSYWTEAYKRQNCPGYGGDNARPTYTAPPVYQPSPQELKQQQAVALSNQGVDAARRGDYLEARRLSRIFSQHAVSFVL